MTLSTDGCLFVSTTGALKCTTAVHRLEGFTSSKLLIVSLSIFKHILDANVRCVCVYVCGCVVCVQHKQGFISVLTHGQILEKADMLTSQPKLLWHPCGHYRNPPSLWEPHAAAPSCCLPACCPWLRCRWIHSKHRSFSPPSFSHFRFHSVAVSHTPSTRSCQSFLSTSIQPFCFIASIKIIWPTPNLHSTNSPFMETSLHPPPDSSFSVPTTWQNLH